MSSSSLYVMDRQFHGLVSEEYRNSWLFSPIVWGVLLDKYMRNEIQTPFGYKKSLISHGSELQPQLNEIINNCGNMADRICWELSMQQVFFTKDKVVVAKGIKDFIESNKMFDLNEEGVSPLESGHIPERFIKIADDIIQIDEKQYPNFVFKNTSVDDGVENWFTQYDEETDEYKEKSLKEWDSAITEFVQIDAGSISFQSNLEYFKI